MHARSLQMEGIQPAVGLDTAQRRDTRSIIVSTRQMHRSTNIDRSCFILVNGSYSVPYCVPVGWRECSLLPCLSWNVVSDELGS